MISLLQKLYSLTAADKILGEIRNKMFAERNHDQSSFRGFISTSLVQNVFSGYQASHQENEQFSYLRNEQTWQKTQGSSQQEAQGELIRTGLYRTEMVVLTCSATVDVSYRRSESCIQVGSQAQQGNGNSQCKRDILAKCLSREKMTKEGPKDQILKFSSFVLLL